MALKPEFMGLLRDIRDRIFPTINTKHDEVVEKTNEVTEIWNNLQEISVEEPVEAIPMLPSGEPGLPTVTYNPITNEFSFGIPSGKSGKDFELQHVVENIVDLYTLTPESGDVAYVNEDSKIYVKRYTNVNLNGLDWTDGVYLTPSGKFIELIDTPLEYVGAGGYVVQINQTESGLEFIPLYDRLDRDVPEPIFPQDEGLPLVAKATGSVYEEILGLPDETAQTGKSVTNLGTKKSSFWSFVNMNPNLMTENQTIPNEVSASVVDGFTIEDGITLTIPDGSTLSVV